MRLGVRVRGRLWKRLTEGDTWNAAYRVIMSVLASCFLKFARTPRKCISNLPLG
jgi:hypothetical protein